MHLATFIQIVAPRIGKHMDLLVMGTPRAHKPLPLHQFQAELAREGAGEKILAGKDFLPETGEKQSQLFRSAMCVRRRYRGVADRLLKIHLQPSESRRAKRFGKRASANPQTFEGRTAAAISMGLQRIANKDASALLRLLEEGLAATFRACNNPCSLTS